MSQPLLAIVGLGLVTPVGLSFSETAANVRASQSRSALKPMLDGRYEAFTLATLPEAALPALPASFASRGHRTARELRMLRLASHAFTTFRKSTAYAKPVPLLLALPEHETNLPLAPERFLDDLNAVHPGEIVRDVSQATWRGRAGSLAAFAAASQMLEKELAECVLVGGVDSFLSTWILSKLDQTGRSKCVDHPDSFVPGEGAGFALVTKAETAKRTNIPVFAMLSVPGEDTEPGHWASAEPYQGVGLCGAVRKLLELAPSTEPFLEVYSTMNGESYWAKEWGLVRVRHNHAFAADARLHHPFEFTGDLGAASGPLLIALAVEGIRNKYRQSPALVYASSDFGPRAALAVSASS